ncbi:hypothetical protein [Burkholderia diffusa]|uniref:hypothetical protein n=1 Tax=Burkholderia diffusa TaxID=488732 RepID=UPI00157B24B5|nr:hypothetical protein [Burkholderia diffusa]NTY40046.1 hypothetical protein [Burkholderia diffusa]
MKPRWFFRSMFNITQPVADALFSWANVLLVVGAVSALVGTIGVFWSGGIREKFADERIAANEAETAKANAEVAQARLEQERLKTQIAATEAETAKANAEVAQARLEQERLKAQMAWRRVSLAQARQLAIALKGKSIELWLTFVGADPESTVFREDINQALTAAGLKTKFFSGYERAVGLTLNGGTPEQRIALMHAFHAAGLPLVESAEPGRMKGELEILVGTKPPPEFQQ